MKKMMKKQNNAVFVLNKLIKQIYTLESLKPETQFFYRQREMLPGAAACTICNEHDHKSSHCPSLHSPLTPGFYTGSGGGGGHSHDDDDDEKIGIDRVPTFGEKLAQKAKKSTSLTPAIFLFTMCNIRC